MFKQLQNTLEALLVAKGPSVTKPIVQFMPFTIKQGIAKYFLNNLLKAPLEEGELEFLEGETLALEVADIGLSLSLGLVDEQWQIAPTNGTESVTFSADSQSLLLIASNKADPDTLFFKRKLMISGDTELGLEIKNLFLGLDPDCIPQTWQSSLHFAADIVQRQQAA
ncbi:SCP2 domain-containing protein [Paraferrimonas sp. SM1919]|uniref:ubiquinone anaerobic biosynthesis accessory factor UbiT n=1 Tax=Paraferrimonas sp. SM1919 TaxID=2662263 RepID=UPI0013D0DD87|nr:SCP2 sterol-binding domain-containing protein [Paraferrimonas sp. SM1919]